MITVTKKQHWLIDKDLAKEVGLKPALLYAYLCDFNYNKMLEEFSITHEDISTELHVMSLHDVRKSLRILKNQNLISVTKKGLPGTNYYKIK